MIATLVRWRWVALIALVLGVGALVPGVHKASQPDNALTVWFLETDPNIMAYREFHRHFGNDEVILIQVEEPDGVFTQSALQRLKLLVRRLEAVDGVYLVRSIIGASEVSVDAEGARFVPLVPQSIPHDPAELAAIRGRAVGNQLLRERLLKHDGRAARVWVQMEVMEDIDTRRDHIVAEVRAVADEVLGETPHPMGGTGVIYSALNQITQHDFGLFVGIGYLLMFLMMWWVMRSIRLVVAAMGAVTIGAVTALGIYGVVGHQLNMVTIVLPTLIIVLGIADAVHFPSAFVHELQVPSSRGRPAVIAATLRAVLVPCLLTTLTTMAAFLALSSSPMAVIRQLGIYAAIGIGAAFVASVALMTVSLHGLPREVSLPDPRWIDRLLAACRAGLHRYPWAFALLSVALAAGAAMPVETDTYTIGYLPDDHPVVRDHRALESRWGAYATLEFLVEPADGYRVDSPAVLAAMGRFVDRASQLEEVDSGFSLFDVYGRLDEVRGDAGADGDSPTEKRSTPRLVELDGSLEWDRSEPAYKANTVALLTTRDGKLGRVTLASEMLSAKNLDLLLDKLERIAAEEMVVEESLSSEDGPGRKSAVANVVPSGYPPLYVAIIDYVLTSQIRGFFTALAIIFLLMLVWLRSLRLAIISMIPNIFPILVMRGVMGVAGIDLDIATATVAAIVVGVAIDDTVHFLHHWRQAERQGMSWDDSLKQVYLRAGRPAVVTTVLLVTGYPVLMFAGVKTVVYFGLLTTVAAAAALFGDLIILPLLLRVFPSRRAPRCASRGASRRAMEVGVS